MKTAIHGVEIELVLGDITNERTDAIVNAANSRLAGGGGVDGAIHRACGPSIMQETRSKYPDGCPTGSAVITGGGKMPVKFVIHAVGPVYRDGEHGEPILLASAYRSSLEAAVKAGCRSISFPSLSTGAYGYPIAEAAPIAVRTVADFLVSSTGLKLVRIVLFDQPTYDAFSASVTARQSASRK
jgi:O-acetyl-ADP-ribose deacetylase (regulator of RNase III)